MNGTISRRLFVGSMLGAPGASSRSGPRRYLFLDSRVVDRSEGAVLRVGKVEKDPANPLFAEDKPWEARYDNLYPNVLLDPSDKLYKCWYSPFIADPSVKSTPREARKEKPYRPGKREMGICLATSRDGIDWDKPELGLVEFEGSTRNNLVLRGPHGAGVFRDAHEKNPARRYKTIFHEGGMAGAFSADGLRWPERISLAAIAAAGDTHNNALWVPSLQRYVCFTRLFDRTSRQRVVGRAESPNFTDWTAAVEIMRAVPEDQTYAMPVFEHAGLYIGLVMIIHVPSDTVRCELACSPDTINWQRIEAGTPLIPLGASGTYDSGCVYAAATPIINDREIRLYYAGSNGPHTGWRDGFFCLARLRPDGFAAMAPVLESRIATVVTRPVRVDGKSLRINADAAGGQVRVGVAGSEDLSVSNCRPLSGDLRDAPVSWGKKALSTVSGRDVQLVFELRSARAFSFHFA
jgi:hypothetical protein